MPVSGLHPQDKIAQDFDIFSRALVTTKDVDPIYPFIGKIKPKNVDPVWFTFCYVSFYSLESALQMVRLFSNHEKWDTNEFVKLKSKGWFSKFGIERRGKQRQVETLVKSFEEVIIPFCENKDKLKNYDNLSLRSFISSQFNHGAWASFKITEVLEKAFGYDNLKLNDLGLDGREPNSNDGPISGLRWLFGRDKVLSKDDFKRFNDFGAELAYEYKFDIGEIETCLCKFHKLVTGKYYVGHDIDELYELYHNKSLSKEDFISAIKACEFLPHSTTGFIDNDMFLDYNGVHKKLKTQYKETQKIFNKKFGRFATSVNVQKLVSKYQKY